MPPDATAGMADVTVIMPAYRARRTVGRALASVAAQTLKPRRVVVVDDGSDDGTFETAESWTGRMNGVELTVLRQRNAGPGAARNRALAAADTGFVAFLDADDEWLPEKLAETMRHFDDPAVAFVGHNYLRVSAGREIAVDCARRAAARTDPYLALFLRNFIDTSTVVARRAAVLAAGGFDESLPSAQDYKLWLAMAGRPGDEFTVFPRALSRYHIVEGSVSSNVALRRDCAIRVLAGELAPLRRRARFPLATAWRRTLLIGRETTGMHLAAGAPVAAAAALARLPADLACVAWRLARAGDGRPTTAGGDVARPLGDPK